MTERFKWFRFRTSSHDCVEEQLLAKPFTQNAQSGFVKLMNNQYSEMRYFWKNKISVPNIDENGLITSQHIQTTEYVDLSLVLHNGTTYLRLQNSGRSLKPLFSELSDLFFDECSLKLITPSSEQLLNLSIEPTEVQRLLKAEISEAVIQPNVLASISLTSNKNMALEKIKLLKQLNYKVRSVIYELQHNGLSGQLSISTNGSVKVSGDLSPWILGKCEQQLLMVQ